MFIERVLMPNAQGLKVVENLGDLENPGNPGNLEEQEDPEDKYLNVIVNIKYCV
jgi:hypothetical protein